MAGPVPYLLLPGTAREALTRYGDIFGCDVALNTFEQFGRTDGPSDAIAHGYLEHGPVALFAADVAGDEAPLKAEGLMLSLLGVAEPDAMKEWFARLSDRGCVVEDLQLRPWGDWDGQVIDRFGVHWLIGFHAGSASAL